MKILLATLIVSRDQVQCIARRIERDMGGGGVAACFKDIMGNLVKVLYYFTLLARFILETDDPSGRTYIGKEKIVRPLIGLCINTGKQTRIICQD